MNGALRFERKVDFSVTEDFTLRILGGKKEADKKVLGLWVFCLFWGLFFRGEFGWAGEGFAMALEPIKIHG